MLSSWARPISNNDSFVKLGRALWPSFCREKRIVFVDSKNAENVGCHLPPRGLEIQLFLIFFYFPFTPAGLVGLFNLAKTLKWLLYPLINLLFPNNNNASHEKAPRSLLRILKCCCSTHVRSHKNKIQFYGIPILHQSVWLGDGDPESTILWNTLFAQSVFAKSPSLSLVRKSQ